MALAIRTTNEQIDALTRELKERWAVLTRRNVTTLETPRVVGVAAVIPGLVPAAVERGLGGDKTEIERAAMRVAMEHERAAGRNPVDLSNTGVGYDVRSEGPDGELRYIEVKGHTTTGDITLYYTEWQTANRMCDEFYIYQVNYALSTPQLWIICDPVGKGIQPVEKVVEYHVRAEQLKAVAERAR